MNSNAAMILGLAAAVMPPSTPPTPVVYDNRHIQRQIDELECEPKPLDKYQQKRLDKLKAKLTEIAG
jgi:hypothetical protein